MTRPEPVSCRFDALAPPLAVSAAQDPAAPDREKDQVGRQEARRQHRARLQQETEKHFISVAPSTEPTAEEAFPLSGKASTLQSKLFLTI